MTAFLIGFGGAVLFAVVSPFALRFHGNRPAMVVHLTVAVVAHIATVLGALLSSESVNYWHVAAGLCAPVMVYVFAFGAVQKSLSANMLGKLAASPDRRLTFAELGERGVMPDFRSRVDILAGAGMVEERNATFAITPKGADYAARVSRLRKSFGLARAGLYRG